jgi:hypothetical protein
MVSVPATAGAVIAAVVDAAMRPGYRQGWAWLGTVDCCVLSALHDAGVKHPGWLRFWQVLCTGLGPVAFRLLTAAVVLIALVRRCVRIALFLVVAVALGYRYVALCTQQIRPPARTAAAVRDPF